MVLPLAAYTAMSGPEVAPECRGLVDVAGGVPLYRSATDERPVARISSYAEVMVLSAGAPRSEVTIGGRNPQAGRPTTHPSRWVDTSMLAPAGSCGPAPPEPAPRSVEDPAFAAAMVTFRRQHPQPVGRRWLVYVLPADEARLRSILAGRAAWGTWEAVVVDEPPMPLDPDVVRAVAARRAPCAVAVSATTEGWRVEPLAGWCLRDP